MVDPYGLTDERQLAAYRTHGKVGVRLTDMGAECRAGYRLKIGCSELNPRPHKAWLVKRPSRLIVASADAYDVPGRAISLDDSMDLELRVVMEHRNPNQEKSQPVYEIHPV